MGCRPGRLSRHVGALTLGGASHSDRKPMLSDVIPTFAETVHNGPRKCYRALQPFATIRQRQGLIAVFPSFPGSEATVRTSPGSPPGRPCRRAHAAARRSSKPSRTRQYRPNFLGHVQRPGVFRIFQQARRLGDVSTVQAFDSVGGDRPLLSPPPDFMEGLAAHLHRRAVGLDAVHLPPRSWGNAVEVHSTDHTRRLGRLWLFMPAAYPDHLCWSPADFTDSRESTLAGLFLPVSHPPFQCRRYQSWLYLRADCLGDSLCGRKSAPLGTTGRGVCNSTSFGTTNTSSANA